MILYSLRCDRDHIFESWFRSSADFDRGIAALSCPACGSKKVEKAIMAPAVRGAEKGAEKTGESTEKMKLATVDPRRQALQEAARELRRVVTENADYVGDRFAEEARKIHYRESEIAARGELTIARMRRERFIPTSTNASESAIGTHEEVVNKLREILQAEWETNPNAEVRYADLEPALLELLGGDEMLRTEAGELASRVLRQISTVELSSAKLRLATENLERSHQLFEQQAIDRNELERERIAFRTQLSETTGAWDDLQLLIKFNLKEHKTALLQDSRNAELKLESMLASNEHTRVMQQTDLVNKEAEYDMASQRLRHWNQQIEAAIVRAPAPGLVVYANAGPGRRRNPVQRGMEVHQGQALIDLPSMVDMIAELRIGQTDLARFEPGKVVTIQVDAYPDRSFTGRVHRVSTLPDSGSRFANNDLRLHKATVVIDGGNPNAALRPGMNATAELLIEVVPDVLTVPLEALQREAGQTYVWRVTPDGPEVRTVQTGKSNSSHVEIVEGLWEGDRIYLGKATGGADS